MIKNKELKFRESDNIFPASLTNTEQNLLGLVLCEISHLQAKGNIKETKTKYKVEKNSELKPVPPSQLPLVYSFSEERLCNIFNCSKQNLLNVLKPAALNLRKKEIGFDDGKGFSSFSLFGRVTYSMGCDFEIELLRSVVKKLSEYKGFSELDFELFCSVNRYAKRILREVSRYKTIKYEHKKMTFDEYKELIGVDKSLYSDYQNIRKLFQPVISQIIDNSKGVWIATDKKEQGFELYKTGRSFTHIKLCLKYNGKGQGQKNLTELDAIKTYEHIYKGSDATIEEIENLTKHLTDLIKNDSISITNEFTLLLTEQIKKNSTNKGGLNE